MGAGELHQHAPEPIGDLGDQPILVAAHIHKSFNIRPGLHDRASQLVSARTCQAIGRNGTKPLMLYVQVCTMSLVDSRIIIKLIEAEGWRLERVTGSHHQFRHPSRPGTVAVPHPRKDMPIGTLKSIARQTGVKLGD